MLAAGPALENQYRAIQVRTGRRYAISTEISSVIMRLPTFIIVPRVRIRPIDQLFVDPSQQTDRGVSQTVPKGLWLGAVLPIIAVPLSEEPLGALDAFLFFAG